MKSALKVLTLNCWGLPFFTPQKKRRFQAITEILKESDWDVVALQEVWLKSDRDWLIKHSGYPYSATFESKSRFLGSGLLLLSRHKILKTDFHPFLVRGFPHRFHEGDFHSSKGIGYVLLDTPMGEVPLFLTHLIAKYVPRQHRDTNRVFRLAQILEVVFYIRQMATPHGFILCGDLNATDEDIEIQTLCALTGIEQAPRIKSPKPRIDFIMCGATDQRLDFRVSRASLVFSHPIEKTKSLILHYSDHQGVSATIRRVEIPIKAAMAGKVLARALRYMEHSMQIVRQIDKAIRWIPVLGFISSYFVKPQLAYIQALLSMVETDLKEAESKHPLRLKGAG